HGNRPEFLRDNQPGTGAGAADQIPFDEHRADFDVRTDESGGDPPAEQEPATRDGCDGAIRRGDGAGVRSHSDDVASDLDHTNAVGASDARGGGAIAEDGTADGDGAEKPGGFDSTAEVAGAAADILPDFHRPNV